METRWFVWDRHGRIAERYYGSTLKKRKHRRKFIVPRFNCENNSFNVSMGKRRAFGILMSLFGSRCNCQLVGSCIGIWIFARVCWRIRHNSRCRVVGAECHGQTCQTSGLCYAEFLCAIVNLNVRLLPSSIQIYVHQSLACHAFFPLKIAIF